MERVLILTGEVLAVAYILFAILMAMLEGL
jgi:hypothetical protein